MEEGREGIGRGVRKQRRYLNKYRLYHGDCLDILPEIPSQSVDAFITDPPYPHIKRDYGTWTTEEWRALIVEGVIPEVRRILKPTGSAVFILQPNSEKVGKMRGWLWEFMAWVCREWNLVQDVWWWNHTTLPSGQARHGLLRGSIKSCVWAGMPDCYKNQAAILWKESDASKARRFSNRADARSGFRLSPSGQAVNRQSMNAAIERRGGVTPFNLLPFSNTSNRGQENTGKNGAGTPLKLADWWTRYICPPGGVILDPFMGSGTMGVAAVQNGCDFIGVENMGEIGYFPTAQERIEKALQELE